MIGKIIGAIAGAQAAKYTKSLGGASGAVLGTIVVPMIARMRLPVLLALGAGAYGYKKLTEAGRKNAPNTPEAAQPVKAPTTTD